MNFSAVILAGGQSSRMGRDKALMEIGGQTLLARQIAIINKAGAGEIFISGRAGVDYSAFGVRVVPDRFPGAGPLAGIEAALAAAANPLLLVLAVDMARMTTELLQHLTAQCDSATGAVPELPTGLEPLVAVYPKRCHEIAQAAIVHSRLSARGFAAACQREQAVRYWPVPAQELKYFSNWNRPDDLPTDGSASVRQSAG